MPLGFDPPVGLGLIPVRFCCGGAIGRLGGANGGFGWGRPTNSGLDVCLGDGGAGFVVEAAGPLCLTCGLETVFGLGVETLC